MTSDIILELQGIERHFQSGSQVVRAVDGVSLAVGRSETLGIVGESGSGKSTLGRLAVGLDRPTAGRVLVEGNDLGELSPRRRKEQLRRVQMIFQDPYSSLNPRLTVGRQIAEPLLTWGNMPRDAIHGRVAGLLEQVGLRAEHANAYPHEFSGGQRQRIAIARALAPAPAIVVADEAVSALDVSVQAQILNLLVDLQQQERLTYLFIAHDMAVVAHVSRRIVVMHRGMIVEFGLTPEVIHNAQHPYTQALIEAVPRFGRRRTGTAGRLPSRDNSRTKGEFEMVTPTHGVLRNGPAVA